MTMPIGDLPGWKQMYAQDFNTDAALGEFGVTKYTNEKYTNGQSINSSAMRGQNGYSDTSGHGYYAPDKVLSVSNSILDWYVHYDPTQVYNGQTGWPMVACPVPIGFTGWPYGRFECRLRADDLPGYKIAFLMWPGTNQWKDGEIDWPETDNLSAGSKARPATTIVGSYDVNGSNPSWDAGGGIFAATDLTSWHKARTEWGPGSIKWYWDDVLVSQTQTPGGVPVKNMQWKLQVETRIGSAPSTSTAGHVQVDWITAYQRVPGARLVDTGGQHFRRTS